MLPDREKRKNDQLSRRRFNEIVFLALGGVAGHIGTRIADALSVRFADTRPQLEPYAYIGDGYTLKRDLYDETLFILTDTRGSNTLPPDRQEYLFSTARKLQEEFKCQIGDPKERLESHDLQLRITNPECLPRNNTP